MSYEAERYGEEGVCVCSVYTVSIGCLTVYACLELRTHISKRMKIEGFSWQVEISGGGFTCLQMCIVEVAATLCQPFWIVQLGEPSGFKVEELKVISGVEHHKVVNGHPGGCHVYFVGRHLLRSLRRPHCRKSDMPGDGGAVPASVWTGHDILTNGSAYATAIETSALLARKLGTKKSFHHVTMLTLAGGSKRSEDSEAAKEAGFTGQRPWRTSST